MVEIAGGFVRKNDGWIGDQRAGDGNALLLPAGKLGRAVMEAIRQPPPCPTALSPGLRPMLACNRCSLPDRRAPTFTSAPICGFTAPMARTVAAKSRRSTVAVAAYAEGLGCNDRQFQTRARRPLPRMTTRARVNLVERFTSSLKGRAGNGRYGAGVSIQPGVSIGPCGVSISLM